MSAVHFGSALRQARRRHGLSLRGLQALVRYDFTYLGQVERGEKPGSLALALGCDQALTLRGELVAAFRSAQGEEIPGIVPVSVLSKDGGEGAEAGVVSPPQSRGLTDDPIGEQVDSLHQLYHGTYSVDDLVRMVETSVKEVSRQLATARTEDSRRRLLRARADAALLAGRLALFDTWVPVTARGYLAMAWESAVDAGDDALAAAACGHLAFVPAREHLDRACLDYLDAAQRAARRSGVPAVASWLAAVEAELLGPSRPDGGLRALDRAVDELARAVTAPTPGWFDYYSPARLEGFRGQVLLRAGRGEEARRALTAALADLEPDAVKQRAVLLADLAATTLCTADPDVDQIATEAMRAATELGRTGYHAAAERLAVLREQLEPWRATAAVRDLDEALSDRSGGNVA